MLQLDVTMEVGPERLEVRDDRIGTMCHEQLSRRIHRDPADRWPTEKGRERTVLVHEIVADLAALPLREKFSGLL